MDGESLTYMVRQYLGESANSLFIDARTTYDYLYEGACNFVERTDCLTSSQTITTVAETSAYLLNADFLKLYMTDDQNRHFVKYYDGTNYHFITFREYAAIYYANQTTSKSIPDNFTIGDYQTTPSQATGTCTSAGTLTNEEVTLTDSAGLFTTTDAVSVGDMIHNTTDNSHGYVTAVTSATVLQTSLYGGTDNDWDSSDAYIIVPQGRLRLIVDPPSSTASHSIYVPYVQRPAPVYSKYRQYRIPCDQSCLAAYAAWKYLYRDKKPDYGDRFYQQYENEARRVARTFSSAVRRSGFRVNLKKTSLRNRSYR